MGCGLFRGPDYHYKNIGVPSMLIRSIKHFDPAAIAESGQCFRMRIRAPGLVEAIHRGRRLLIETLGDERLGFSCTQEEFHDVWEDYFDLSTDYSLFLNAVDREDGYLLRAAGAGQGLRILRQDPWEVLISFILSQRKSIPAIRDGIEKISLRLGSPVTGEQGVYDFPTPQRLAVASLAELSACSLGYRAPYIQAAARSVAAGETDLNEMDRFSDETLMQKLLALYGVGVKVASCVMLFGYHRLDLAPVDVWIQRVIENEYGGVSPFPKYKGFAGVMQQYMFYDQIYRKRSRRLTA
jgi:N-glycosylase/DNA lyase